MGSEWNRTTLGEILSAGGGTIQTGPFGSQLHAADYVSNGIPVIMPVNIADNRVSTENIARISESDANRLSRHIVKEGDIVYSRRGDVTRKALITSAESGMFCGTGCLLVRPGRNVHPRFLTYHLSTPENQEWIKRHAIGATMPNLNTGILAGVPLNVPSLATQESIASILGALDDKIELNRQMNTTLEAIAQALFKSWFVDFDPVIDNALAAGNPIPEELTARAERRVKAAQQRSPEHFPTLPTAIRQQFPDRFVFTETMGWVPEGWRLGCFGDLAEHVRANVKAEDIAGNDLYVGLEHIGRKHLFLSEHGLGESVDSNKSKFEKDDLLFGKLRPYFHKVCIAPSDGICSTDILVLRAKTKPLQSYMVLTAYTEEFVEYANLRSTGTRMPRASAKDLLQYPVIIPPTAVLMQFENTVASIWAKGTELVEQARSLTQLRDTLLPKLLSGQLRVPEPEQMLAEAL